MYEEKYSNELNELLSYMKDVLARDIPTPTLSPDYFILAILNQRKSYAYSRLDSCLPSGTLNAMEDSYSNYLSTRAITVMKPGREIRFDENLTKALEGGNTEREKMGHEEITSEHVLLFLLEPEEEFSDSRIKRVFNKAGLSYNMLYEKVAMEDKHDNKVVGVDIATGKDSNTVMIKFDSNMGDPNEMIKNLMMGNIPGMPSQKNKNSKHPNIDSYCSNINDLVEMGKIDPLVGRDNETNQIVRILGRRRKNNVIIVGGEGVGKTCLAENLAYKIIHEEVPEFLLGKTLVSLDMTALMAGTTLRGMFEERVKGLLDEIKADGNYLLFIDNIGNVLADKGKNDYDISSMLSHALENGELQVIGTSDFKSYRSTFDKDPSLARRFQRLIIESPSKQESIDILNGIKPYYETFHGVKFTDEAILSCVNLADRYISERNLPDSAIDVMDEAGSLIGTSSASNDEIRNLKKQITETRAEIERLKKEEKFIDADMKEKEDRELTMKMVDLAKQFKKDRVENPIVIDSDVILNIIASKTGIPVSRLTSDDKRHLATMDERLKSEIIGQDEAINVICKALKRSRVGLSTNKCMFSGLMIGKSGVGKTLIAKKLAKEIFGDEKALVRFDMSEYPDKTAVNKLIGSNPGYVGYEEGGQLTETIKNKKHCVLLLDEIEKADPEVYNIFLQVLDEGFLTDNSGMRVDFKNVIVLFTSNVGTKAASDFGKGIGFNDDTETNTKRILLKQLKNRFPPEFLNRLNSVIYFNNLTDNNLKDIIKLEIKKFEERMNNLGFNIVYDDAVVDYLLSIVREEKEFGARPITRAIQDNIEDKVTDLLLERDYDNGYTFSLSCFSNEISVS